MGLLPTILRKPNRIMLGLWIIFFINWITDSLI